MGKTISADDVVLIIEVRQQKTDTEIPIPIFPVVLRNGDGVWEETFGSVELLNAFLRGIQSSLRMVGYVAHSLEWNFPTTWSEPSGKRWTVTKDGLTVDQNLNAQGEEISI